MKIGEVYKINGELYAKITDLPPRRVRYKVRRNNKGMWRKSIEDVSRQAFGKLKAAGPIE